MARQPKKKAAGFGRSKGIVIALACMGIFLVQLLVYTWCRVQYTRVGYDISRACNERAHLQDVQKVLQLEMARLKSPERLSALAARKGLRMPAAGQVVEVR